MPDKEGRFPTAHDRLIEGSSAVANHHSGRLGEQDPGTGTRAIPTLEDGLETRPARFSPLDVEIRKQTGQILLGFFFRIVS